LEFGQRVAIVTGASSGIGFHVAAELLSGGCKVVCVARGQSRLTEAATALITQTGVDATSVITLAGDAADEQTSERTVNAAVNTWGRLDIVVNNAGGGTGPRTVDRLTSEIIDQSYRNNVLTTMMMCKAAMEPMSEAGYGRIVNIASLAGRSWSPLGGVEYAAHKAAVIGFTRHFAAQVAFRGIAVNAVAPGIIETSRVAKQLATFNDVARKSVQEATPARRFGRPEEVAAAVCFLSSERASFIIGAVLDINGGRYM
jgi:3-oxoacyl-[acyl-carrier protein] reductase